MRRRQRVREVTGLDLQPLASWIDGPVFEGATDVLPCTSPLGVTNSVPVGIKGSVWFVDVSDKYNGLRVIVR